MPEDWIKALYPLGYLSSALFMLRFAVQWLYSESKGKSVVPSSFWWISLMGNLLLLVHSVIQMQFHVTLVQSLNGVISWRNLNLMSSHPKSLKFTLSLATTAVTSSFLFFLMFSPRWFALPGTATEQIHWVWHLFGTLGIVLFSSRFLFQWWQAEKKHKSTLPLAFWWMSVAGGFFSIIYFAKISDPVNLIGPAMGMIPYLRNLMLIYKKHPEAA